MSPATQEPIRRLHRAIAFIDLVHSSTAWNIEPKLAHEIIEQLIDVAFEVAEQEEEAFDPDGWNHTGDGLVLLFEHSAAAARCCLRLIERWGSVREQLIEDRGHNIRRTGMVKQDVLDNLLRLRIGLHVGYVKVAERRGRKLYFSDDMNRAQRVEAAAKQRKDDFRKQTPEYEPVDVIVVTGAAQTQLKQLLEMGQEDERDCFCEAVEQHHEQNDYHAHELDKVGTHSNRLFPVKPHLRTLLEGESGTAPVIKPTDDADVIGDIRELLAQAKAAENLGDHDQARQYAEDALNKIAAANLRDNELEAEVRFVLAYALDELKQYKLAIEQLMAAEGLMPNAVPILTNLAIAHDNAGEYAKAVEIYQRADKIQANDPDILFNWANSLRHMDDNLGAVALYVRANEHRPNHPATHINWAVALRRLGDYQGAIKLYMRADELESNRPSTLGNWAIALLFDKSYAESFQKIEEAIVADPDYDNSWHIWRLILSQSPASPERDASRARYEELGGDMDLLQQMEQQQSDDE